MPNITRHSALASRKKEGVNRRTIRRRQGTDVSAEFVPRSLFILIVLSIFVSELVVMFLLQWAPEMDVVTEAIVDAALISVFTLPLLYQFFYKPFTQHVRNREKAEKELELLAIFVEQAEEGIIITDKKGSIEYVNPAFEQNTGYTSSEALGENPRMLKSGVHDSHFYEEMWRVLLAGEVWKGQIINRRKDGTLIEEKTTISPLFDEKGDIIHLVATKRDLTAELSLERQVRQAQKMEAIGVLAGGIAHDFNNILSAIIGYTEMALDEIEEGNMARDDLQEVLKGGVRAKDLVRQILTFSRQSEAEFAPMELHKVFSESLKLLRASLPATVKIVDDIDQTSGSILGDPTQLSQILMNLGANAGHAMEDGGILTCSLKKIEVDAAQARALGNLQAGPHLKMSVSDTGHGMAKETLDRIFEPFFTTKEVGKGTGLGLSAVHGIILNHGGAIHVSSEPGHGTTFDIYLPRIVREEVKEEEPAQAIPNQGSERVLYIDDEETIVRVMVRGLGKLGYEVTGMSDPAEALELFEDNPDNFDMVVTDLAMPNVPGEKVISKVRSLRPTIPIILTTGYSADLSIERIKKMNISRQLIKPISAKDLGQAVRAVFDSLAVSADQ